MRGFFKIIAAVTLLSASAQAEDEKQDSLQSGETRIKADSVVDKKSIDDIDNEITNARMRAETGSKSEWSVKTAFGINGGSIEDPLSKDRPNLLGGFGTRRLTSLSGSVSVKKALTKNDSLSFGTGVSLLTPFHTQSYQVDDNGDIDDPSLEYARVYKLGPLQMVSSLGLAWYTSDSARSASYQNNLNIGQNLLHGFDNGLTLGVAFDLNFTQFDDNQNDRDRFAAKNGGANLGANQDTTSVGVYPYAEYTFNDTYSLRTVFGIANYRHIRANSDVWDYEKQVNYQSVGLGISPTRDIYLYPNIQFIPGELGADLRPPKERTNVALTAYINIF